MNFIAALAAGMLALAISGCGNGPAGSGGGAAPATSAGLTAPALDAGRRAVPPALGSVPTTTGVGTYPIAAPNDTALTRTIGPFTVSTFSPVTLTPFENSTNIYFRVTNTATQARTLEFTSMGEVFAGRPYWLYHFFKMFGVTEQSGATPVTFAAGETKTLEFYTSKDLGGGLPLQATLPFRFRSVEDNTTGTLEVTFVGDDMVFNVLRSSSSMISGRITDAANAPVANAFVSVGLFNENIVKSTRTDANGVYAINVLSLADVATIMGPRPFPYGDVAYFLTAEADGYSMAYRSAIRTQTGKPTVVNIALAPRAAATAYRLTGTLATNGLLAYWVTRFAGSGDRVVSVQGQHPPVDPGPGHIIATDLAGRELWRVVTGAQCWGLDVSPDGRTIAAGCYDGYVYVVGYDGTLKFRKLIGDRPSQDPNVHEVMESRFSPDGKYLVVDGAGGLRGISVLDATTGDVSWTSAPQTGNAAQYAYKARWSPDGQRIVAGSGGLLSMFTAQGALVWRQQMGESPLWLEIDGSYNVYAAGKTRVMLSYAGDGTPRWSRRLANTSNEANSGISLTGNIMVSPTFNGMLQAFDLSGNMLWQRMTPTVPVISPQGVLVDFIWGTGHNATSLTASGDRFAVGTRGWAALVYAKDGTLLWSHTASMRNDFAGPDPATHGNYTGAVSIAISPDGRHVAAGYADSVIRIFELQPN